MPVHDVKVAVIYYSSTGTVAELARRIADAAEHAGADVRLRRTAELAPQTAIDANPAWAANAAATADIMEAAHEDMLWADAVIFGSPTRFGNVTSQLKQYIDTLGGLWQQGRLADKVYSGFTASATKHGGQESTLLALYHTIHHFGGILVTPGYTDPAKYSDGNPYGTSHVGGPDTPLDDDARTAARIQAERVVKFTKAIKHGLSPAS
ncbi:NAD(P)H dehydrogenase (quinone) [Streptomyces sp. 2333.5]|uniref:NAD(P)H:quinone oxidoreductase n=1 Tax=unclassified Streptomyces TaxID=2593676 RepID=UPI00089D908C|nr:MULTISPECIES: NAD(P)H:quinone oxidoreductase [unclassified Streptomyces]PJJ03548.1 NAD(P)H dehydrogenase (quinone) [Streptomyces sp. 2333.5]SED35083.1 NAD(P)H dehydrogenase (quinone) [Streptomyces sp. 2314.4]SEE49828.1 NAD(P)H dehydrogenase (quinone) [Streptomyces sp. 2112.2]SOE12070.1 NAD(P)H dehydrogenase (quinone) [Streptomyces sp. 2323.1]